MTNRRRLRVPQRLKLLSWRDVLHIALPAVLLAIAAFWIAAQYIKPAPPSQAVLGTGADGGAYQRFGALYADVLARFGIRLVTLPSAGSVENLQRLRDPETEIDVAFIQGGAVEAMENEGLLSLGELYYEPLWIFYRQGAMPRDGRVLDLKGKRLAIGGEGSDTQRLTQEILAANGIDARNTKLIADGGFDVVGRLQQGKLDAVFVVGPTQSALVWALLYTPGVRLLSLAQSPAYAGRFPYLTPLTLPRGAIDLVRDIPPHDVRMLASTATLLVREKTHPAVIWPLLQAASEVHGEAGVFQKPGEFPRAGQPGEFPLAPEAGRYYTTGKPFLQRYLPFWAAILADRLMVMLLPLVAVLYPLFKLAPLIYGWRVRSRIYRRYGELKFLESAVEADPQQHTREEWLRQLDAIEEDASHIRTPLAFADMLYTLRQHVNLAREAILKRTTA